MEDNNLDTVRHSASHVLMQALARLYGATPGVGPAIENGFYHDIDAEYQITTKDFSKIEKEMKKIIKENLPIKKKVMSINKGIKFLKDKGYIHTAELAEDLKSEGESEISFYEQGEFINMCKGPHLSFTGELNPKAFKLTKLAGAYFKGDENNKMLQRVYGVVFQTKEELDKYLEILEEAKKRDHRKLGQELDLFYFSDLVGSGLPLFTPKGTIIIDELQKHIEKVCRNYGFEKVSTPHLAKIDLYEISGHARKFGDELLNVKSHYKQDYVLKPVQCPHQTQIYASKRRSYKDLPIRYMESNKQYRDEKPGEIGGLNRVIAITVEDGHTFCTVDQVKDEIKSLINVIKDYYSAIGMWGDHWVSLSVRDYEHPEKYIGESKDWDKCELILQEISDEMGLDAKKREGEAALYGPKLDFMFKDAFGREIQIPTVQLDFATPKRFNLLYTNKSGKESHPVMIHRAILGSYERFLVLLIERFAGAFPLWLSPVQVKILPISDKFIDYVKGVADNLKSKDIRVEIDSRSESLSKKIREAEIQKVPYMVIVGEKEMSAKKIRPRHRKEGDIGEMKIEEFIKRLKEEIESKSLS